jgi:hypothetical protein
MRAILQSRFPRPLERASVDVQDMHNDHLADPAVDAFAAMLIKAQEAWREKRGANGQRRDQVRQVQHRLMPRTP